MELCRESKVYKLDFYHNNHNYINILIDVIDDDFEEFTAVGLNGRNIDNKDPEEAS